MKARRLVVAATLSILALSLFVSCAAGPGTLSIVSGSQNEALEFLIEEFERAERVRVDITYMGSVQMMLEMDDDEFPFDAVWPADSLWISLGDRQRRVKHARSIMKTPVVFGFRHEVAERLDFIGRKVTVAEILAAIRAGELNFTMTSATQSSSGACGYLGFLNALSGNPQVLSMDDLTNEQIGRDVRDLLGGVYRSSGSSAWLKDMFVQSGYDAMVNYEALMIEANQELVAAGREPLQIIYPEDGVVIADSPLAYVNRGDPGKEEIFLQLQDYLLSGDVQRRIAQLGRRTGIAGQNLVTDPAIFNPDWGIRTDGVLTSIRLPAAEVIYEALRLYQTDYRKPSFTVFALDFSGSMAGDGEEQLKEAMRLLLDQNEAGQRLLNTGRNDVTVILPFSHEVLTSWRVAGNEDGELLRLAESIRRFWPDGGTNIYEPVMVGLEIMSREPDIEDFVPAIVLMTDGENTEPMTFQDLSDVYDRLGLDVPVFAIMFGRAVESELEEIVELTRGRLFDGRQNLIQAFRSVRGYN